MVNRFDGIGNWNTSLTLFQHDQKNHVLDALSQVGLGKQDTHSNSKTVGLKISFNISVRNESFKSEDTRSGHQNFSADRHSLLSTFQYAYFTMNDRVLLTPSIRSHNVNENYDGIRRFNNTERSDTKENTQIGLRYVKNKQLPVRPTIGDDSVTDNNRFPRPGRSYYISLKYRLNLATHITEITMLFKQHTFNNLNPTVPLLLAASVALGACSSDDDAGSTAGATDNVVVSMEDAGTTTDGGDTTNPDTTRTTESFAFAATGSSASGHIERISFANGFTVNGTYPAIDSDIRVDTDGKAIYQLSRSQLDSLTKFSATDTSVLNYQYSLNGDETATNPHDIVFVSETKAYVLRYASPTIWIVNPSATTEAEFKIGEINIAAYDPDTSDDDLSPNATSGAIVDGKLFVLMQRLSETNPVEQGYVAVFDTTNDTEIDTGKGEAESLKGIPLGPLNPTNIRYNETTDEIYVTGRGNIFVERNMLQADPYQGGLFAIDYTTYDINQLLDDGDADTNTNGFIQRTLVVNDEKGYVSFYSSEAPEMGSSRTTLYTFNPSTGEVGDLVTTGNGEVASLNIGSSGNVWVGINGAATPGFTRLNITDDSTVEPYIATSFNPINVVFLDVPTP